MATRDDVVRIALAEDGYHDNLGYDEVNKYAEYFGISFGIAYCDIFVAWAFAQAGLPLPDMHGIGVPLSSGAQYCPDSWNYAVNHGATRNSWEAQPGDQVIFNWNGDSAPLGGESHTEIVTSYDASTGWLFTVGGNSGPSNVDGFRGTGGVHRHAWFCPAETGNSLIQGVIDTSKLVTFSAKDNFTLTPEDKTFIDGEFTNLRNALETVIEGGIASDKNPYGIVGLRDLAKWQSEDRALLVQIAQHLGLKVSS